jgi:hypothetical protein
MPLYAFFEPSARYHLVKLGTQMDLTLCRIPLHTRKGKTRIGKIQPPHLVNEIPEGTKLCSNCRRVLEAEEKRKKQEG